MSFDPLQREYLAAMGYTVYSLQGGQEGQAGTGAGEESARAPVGAPGGASEALLLALLRAAGRDPGEAEAVALCRRLLPGGGLPDARTRRALWPQLRALRARAAPR